ncbi:rRNA maturation RNase YbeY [Papillibacter cinnamivorans]|uniref:Endoribonuclease YbeY n=1 Tax=Papillibacter cinnamivorans DSM 12816 TaxID=1122930 RepID=A0A1W1Z167_9FIRM|nr:rRNA maturation RNase YbeY [Papillibacter cinnamivorans]SMC41698.1 probable rRNA maturation factor [Papillibacter cinnamivorans DSM 12816]
MKTHKVNITAEKRALGTRELNGLIRRCVRGALKSEGAELPCEINVLLTDEEGIRTLNREYRDTDKPTDVLSFPMFDLTPGEPLREEDADPETGLIPLGDIAISVPRAREQAAEYGHSEAREAGFLTVHSVLHLLGYDHTDEGAERACMRERERAILEELKLTRDA